MTTTARINLNIFNGARKPFTIKGDGVLVTLINGRQRQLLRDFFKFSSIPFDVPFENGLADFYDVIVFADRHVQAGFAPVHVSDDVPYVLDLMLLPKKSKFNFDEATWAKLKKSHAPVHAVLSQGASDADGKARYEELLAKTPGTLAAFFNLTTALKEIHLPNGNALSYIKGLIWEEQERMKEDRFFAYADEVLVDQVVRAAEQGQFASQTGLAFNHPGATRSYKQKQFGEANVQFSFHENDRKKIGDTDCVKVEIDMDYFKDLLAHLFLEVIPNKVSKGKTDPRKIYMLRWIAGRQAGIPEFDPPYTIEQA